GIERKSVTETDLITAGGSSENAELPNTVNSDTSTPPDRSEADAPIATPTAETAPTADVASGDRPASLSTMVLPELRTLAKQIGVEGASGMRKGDLIAAIREHRGESNGRGAQVATDTNSTQAPAADTATESATDERTADGTSNEPTRQRRERRGAADGEQNKQGDDRQNKGGAQRDQAPKRDGKADSGDQQQGDQQGGQNRGGGNAGDDDEGRGGRRGRRFRDRRRRGERGGEGGGGGDRDTELREDDVVQPVAGILDVLDNYAFVRTSGYLAGPNDVYVSMNMVRKNGLRRGDAITGAVRVPKDGEQPNQRQKFNPLVRLDTVNGGPVEDAKNRPDFNKLTPLYPNQRLRLETTPDRLTTRVIDLIMPIGKGQRALIVSPPKAGKTTILQDIANGVAQNNPECHLMVVLVDERPEEVTDMQRSVKGEVIASTFDRPPSDHTQAAELAIERAKRLVEQGRDVIVLLDSITRLGRAYNNASPASGRILSGGVDSTALYPPKRFLGAARNIEFGGSLTIIATAMVETGSTGDTVIFEEFKGTGNAELKLDRKISERRVFPAVDVNPSGTRKDELLLSTDEFAVVHKLRRVLSGLDPHQAIDLLMSQLRKTKTNYEFLVQVSKTTPASMDSD
ncbi:MAG: transcription termination factor Rho, partial [Mycobacterium sp.]|nr:transcription termination factor Rho [Mycobacterium sp.]